MMGTLRFAAILRSGMAAFLRLLLTLLILLALLPRTPALAQIVREENTAMAPAPTNLSDAFYISQSVPSAMLTNGEYNVSVTMKNRGTTTWKSSSGYVLGSQAPQDNGTWGLARVQLPVAILPDEEVTFNFRIRAPSAPGNYRFQWRMLQEGVRWFGDYTPELAITVRDPNNAAPWGQSVPAQMETGKPYSVSVTMYNNGDTTWNWAQQYTLMAQSPHNNTTWGFNRVPLPLDNIAPGQAVTFTFQVTAPTTPGSYPFQWGMQREGHGSFGTGTAPSWVNVVAPPPPVNNAEVVSVVVPAHMQTNLNYSVAVTMRNNGTTTWSRAQQYTLMSQSPHNNMTWGFNRVPLPVDNIAPGQSATFTFQVTAPNGPGSYPFQWGMQREGYGAFGPGTAPVSVSVVAPWNDAQVVSMSVPPVMQTEKPYNVAVTMLNNGTTTWMPGVYSLGSRNPTDNLIWGPGRVALATAVGPGQQYTFNFPVTAPAAGDYVMQWGVLSQVEWFGALASSAVTVTEDLSRVTFIHTDGLGSPVARTDGAGTVLSRTRYEPYGYVATGATPTIGFTGHVNDADTGLTYMQQRYYDPVAGRFLSVDPVVTDASTGNSFNRYAYANNSPFKYIDPDGREVVIKGSEEYKRRVSDDLNKISSGQRGAGLVSAAEKTSRTIEIVPSSNGKNSVQNVPSFFDRFRKGSDAKIEYNPDSTKGGKDENGSRSRPAFVGLGHELGHAVAITDGNQSRDRGTQKIGTTPPSEKQSMQAENDVRADHKLPARKSYYE